MPCLTRSIPRSATLGLSACIYFSSVVFCLGAYQNGSTPPAVPEDYRIGPSDVLAIQVWKEPEVSVPDIVVRVDGKISMPLLGDVDAAGMKPVELQSALVEKLANFINSPVVAVSVKAINSRKVYVIGGVHKEGPLNLTRPMTVLQALNEAGGFVDFARKGRIYVLRKIDGKEQRLPFDYNAVVKGKKLEQNIVLMPDDTIVVPN